MKRKILAGQINFPYTLAPMVGLSHIALRLLIREYLPANATTFWPTEMLSSRRLSAQQAGLTPETLLAPNEDNIVPQILGNEERFIAASASKLEKWGAVGIDINMGCPVKKALRHNYGVALMGDPNYAASIVEMTVKNTSLPVSVKLRAGLQKNSDVLIDIVQKIEKAGASWVCLHPRTAEQKRKGHSDWQQIKILRERVQIPIVGNGDVQIWSDAIEMQEQTNCDAVMIGRALTARPWMFWQLGHHMGLENPRGKKGLPPQDPQDEAQEYGRALIRFIELCQEYFTPDQARRKVRFFITVSHPWLNFGHRLNSIAHKAKDFEQMKDQLREFFHRDGLSMASFTELRY